MEELAARTNEKHALNLHSSLTEAAGFFYAPFPSFPEASSELSSPPFFLFFNLPQSSPFEIFKLHLLVFFWSEHRLSQAKLSERVYPQHEFSAYKVCYSNRRALDHREYVCKEPRPHSLHFHRWLESIHYFVFLSTSPQIFQSSILALPAIFLMNFQ